MESLLQKKIFKEKFTEQSFSEQVANLHQKTIKIFFVDSFIQKLKAKGFQNTMDLHYEKRI